MGEVRIDLSKRAFSPGEEVDGNVHLLLRRPISRRSATLSLVGKEETTVRYQSGEDSRTASEELEFLRQEVPLALPEERKGRTRPGDYNFPFRFILPPDLPPSYKGEAADITYEIRAKIDVPLGFDINDSVEIDVNPDIRSFPSLPIGNRSYSWSEQDSPGISFTLERCVYGRGEVLNGRCSFRNPRSKNLRKINVALRWIEAARAEDHRDRSTVMEQVAHVPLRGRILMGESSFRIPIPERAPPTFKASLCSVSCILHVGLDIAWAPDVDADQAIGIVGTAGEENLPERYDAGAQRGTGHKIPESLYQPWYRDRTTTRMWCYNCGTPTGAPDALYCPNCGSLLRVAEDGMGREEARSGSGITRRASASSWGGGGCIVCGGRLGQREDVVWCPHCGGLGHRRHMIEYVHSKKTCPACGKILREEEYE